MSEPSPSNLENFAKHTYEQLPYFVRHPIETAETLYDRVLNNRRIADPVIIRLERFYHQRQLNRIENITNWGINKISETLENYYNDQPIKESLRSLIIRRRQLRAAKILLLHQDISRPDSDWLGNPITDVMLLLIGTAKDEPSLPQLPYSRRRSPKEYYYDYGHFYPISPHNPPEKVRLYQKHSLFIPSHPLQYAEIEDTPIRIIRGHEHFPTITDRAINALNFTATNNPHVFDSAIAEYHQIFGFGENHGGLSYKLCIALLEILNNCNQIQNPNYQPLIKYLTKKAVLDYPSSHMSEDLKSYSSSKIINWDEQSQIIFSRLDSQNIPVPRSSHWENQVGARQAAENQLEMLSSPAQLLKLKLQTGRLPPNIASTRNLLHAQITKIERDIPQYWVTHWNHLLEIANQGPLPPNFLSHISTDRLPSVGLEMLKSIRNYFIETSSIHNAKIESIPPDIGAISSDVIKNLSQNPLALIATKWQDPNFRAELCPLIESDPKSFAIFARLCSASLLDSAYHLRNLPDSIFSKHFKGSDPDDSYTFLNQLSGHIQPQPTILPQAERDIFSRQIINHLSSLPEVKDSPSPSTNTLDRIAERIAALKPTTTPAYKKFIGIEFPKGLEYKFATGQLSDFDIKLAIKHGIAAAKILGVLGLVGTTAVGVNALYNFTKELRQSGLLPDITHPILPAEFSPTPLVFDYHVNSFDFEVRFPNREISKPRPVLFAHILNLPENQKSLLSDSFWPLNENSSEFSTWSPTDPKSVTIVEQFDTSSLSSDQTSFMVQYQTSRGGQLVAISAPDNFVITKTQIKFSEADKEKNHAIYINEVGQLVSSKLFQDHESLLTIQTDQTNANHIGKRTPSNGDTYSPAEQLLWRYQSETDYPEKINASLEADPQLQALHRSFINEIRNYPTDANYQTETIIHYLDLLGKYINENHYYSLSTPDSVDGKVPSNSLELMSLIKNHSGFRCEIAADITKLWLDSAGVKSYKQYGFKPIIKDDTIWKGWGHVRNVAYLPDGSSLIIDNTPPIKPGLTPPEDLELVNPPEVTNLDLLKADASEIAKKALIGGVTTAATLALVVHRLRSRRNRPSPAVEVVETVLEPIQPPLDITFF